MSLSGESDPSGSSSTPETVFAQFVARAAGDEQLGFDEWVRGYPEMESELRALHSSWSAFARHIEDAASLFYRPRNGEDPAEEAPHFNLKPGFVLDDYELGEVLGQGGMGQVWEAMQLSVHRRVAVKVLSPTVAQSARLLRRFQREAEAGARLDHPNIVAVHTFGQQDGLPYIVQELVEEGATLADFLAQMREEPALPADYGSRAARFVAKVADALQAAHDHGIIHRDVKPQNILIGENDEPKVSDFGLARLEDLQPLSLTGEVIGTYCYMSPEQALHKKTELDARTDIFSLGATFYEMLTFRRAFDGESRHEIVEKLLRADPPDVRKLRPGVPADLAVICAKALEKERSLRYQTMAELAADLRRYLNSEPIRAVPCGPVSRVRRWARRRPGLLIGALVATLLLTTIGVLGAHASVAARTRRLMTRNNHYLQAELAIQTGDLDDALAEVNEAHATLGPDPAGHLMLAGAYASRGRFPESEEQVRLAERAGFSAEGVDDSPRALYHRGLYLFARTRELGPDATREAIRMFEEAVERSPKLYAALYPLYKLKRSIGDAEGAQRALESYQSWLAPRGEFYRVLEAQRLQLEGDFASSARILEELLASPELDDRRARELRIRRSLGQVYLQLDEPQVALQHLERAVDESPFDAPSIANLAHSHYELARRATQLDALRARIASLERQALRTREVDPHLFDGYRLPALGALHLLDQQLIQGLEIPPDDWKRADAALERLREFAPDDPAVDQLEAHVAFLRARASADPDVARANLERCLEIHPHHVDANIVYAQQVFDPQDCLPALERFRAARDAWNQVDGEERWFSLELDPTYRLAANVWIYRCASLLGFEQEALEAKQAARLQCESAEVERSKNDLLTFAEFLATAPSARLVDCELALDLVYRFELERAFVDTSVEAAAAEMLETIHGACR